MKRDKLSCEEKPMNQIKPPFANWGNDHTTVLTDETLYPMLYLFLRIIMCIPRSDVVYEHRGKPYGDHVQSMTYALNLGHVWCPEDEEKFQFLKKIMDAGIDVPIHVLLEFYEYFKQKREADKLRNTLLAVVQPSEPAFAFSHVREMIRRHSTCAHVEHIAYSTSDIRAFHTHAQERGFRFVTPILCDLDSRLLQVFGGEFSHPGSDTSSALFFEFVQRFPKEQELPVFFLDDTFVSLYDYKQAEYENGNIVPFISSELFQKLYVLVGHKKWWDITEDDVVLAEKLMMGGK